MFLDIFHLPALILKMNAENGSEEVENMIWTVWNWMIRNKDEDLSAYG